MHVGGENEFAQGGAVVTGRRFSVDQQQATVETHFAQRAGGRSTCSAGTDDDEATVVWRQGFGKGLDGVFVDVNLIVDDLDRIADQSVQCRRFTQASVVNGELGLVPGADQMAVANGAVRQWGTGVGALALIRPHLVPCLHQYDFLLANFNLNTAISMQIGEAGDPMHGHMIILPGFLLGVGREGRGSENLSEHGTTAAGVGSLAVGYLRRHLHDSGPDREQAHSCHLVRRK
jgi:hypothetical protein